MASRGIAYELWVRIESERFVRRWTAVRMAEHIGLPRGTIARLKEGTRPPTAATVHKIADVLDIDFTEAGRMAGLKIGTSEPHHPSMTSKTSRTTSRRSSKSATSPGRAQPPPEERYRLARVLIAEYDRQRERSRGYLKAVAEAWVEARSA